MTALDTDARDRADQDRDSPLPSVLFVDDEDAVLAGLRTSLRRLRKDYRFHFARGGHEALEILAGEPIDVVVSDMRMPGMNGVDLLRAVKQDHPHVVRYVLSGEAEWELVVNAIPVTHRWLTKPCSHEALVDALAEAVRHRNILRDPELLRVIAGIDALPSPPPLYRELVATLEDSEASITRIAELISGDPAVSAKLLQWANSAFAAGSRVADVRTAVVRLGLNVVSYLVLSAEMASSLDQHQAIPGIGIDDLPNHVRTIANLASALTTPGEALVARTAGGLTEIGLLLEASHFPARLQAAYARAEAGHLSLVEAERELYGMTHADLAGHLLSVWGLPSQLVLAVEGAHELPPVMPAPLTTADAVRAARLAVQQLPYHAAFGSPHRDQIDDARRQAALSWLDLATTSLEEA